MANQAVFLGAIGENPITNPCSAGFLLLYQQSVLLALKEQGILEEGSYASCLNALAKQTEKN